MRPTTFAALITLAILVAPVAVADPTHDGQISLASWTEGTLQTTQAWEGADASDFRQSLDTLFGDSDGEVSSEEVETVEEASKEDMVDKKLPLLTVDGEEAVVTAADVALEGAEGSVDSEEAVTVSHDVTVSIADSGADERQVVLAPFWNGTISFAAPAGWIITSVEGLDDAEPIGGNVTGDVVADRQVTLVVAMPEAEPEPAAEDTNSTIEDTPQEAAPPEGDAVVWDPPEDDGGFDVPAPGVVLALAGAAAAAFAFGRKR